MFLQSYGEGTTQIFMKLLPVSFILIIVPWGNKIYNKGDNFFLSSREVLKLMEYDKIYYRDLVWMIFVSYVKSPSAIVSEYSCACWYVVPFICVRLEKVPAALPVIGATLCRFPTAAVCEEHKISRLDRNSTVASSLPVTFLVNGLNLK